MEMKQLMLTSLWALGCDYEAERLIDIEIFVRQDPLSDQWPSKCPRVDYALYGYNSLKGSPLSSGAGPGFTLPIFNAEYKSGSETSGCRYTMPRGVVLAPDISCVASFRSEVIQTPYDLTRFMGRTARLDDGGWGPPFVASLSFQETVAELRQKVFIMSTASCSAYRVSLLQLEPPTFHSMFLEWILKLNNTNDENTYLEFLDTYGTHFVSQTRLGASLTMVHKMENNIYMQHEEDEFTAAASYSSIALLGHTETLTSDQKKKVDEFLSKVETIPIAVGVSPPSGANSMSWLTAVKADPIAINYDLTSIDVLFSERFMGGSSPLQSFSIDYLKVRNQIISIKERYCRFLKQRGELSDCEDPTPGFSLRSTRHIFKTGNVTMGIRQFKLEISTGFSSQLTHTELSGDSLKLHNNQGFTTHDQDNDNSTTTNCALFCLTTPFVHLKSIPVWELQQQPHHGNEDDYGHHLVLEPEHSDLSENQVNAKSDSKQQSREKDAGQDILNDQPPLQGPGQVNTRLPGVDFALYGYNSLKGCPLAPGRDPGFTLPLFSADYSAGQVITDNSYSVPRGVILAPDVSCVTSFTSEVIQTPYDLTKFMSHTAQLDGGSWGAPFAANPVFQKILAELRQKVLIVATTIPFNVPKVGPET
ncbi:hypothetical protein C0Q70_12993 [Pomacea canaliculata]|uniref:MACPF domain-containing protein n=1 Tax=Pomacea canaliculata TaxID=400727 RepID=A0A2T7P323_POMCA|nr:hypothetical protein C0Q70_12993 [Pomacea canaliculata]